MMKRVFSPFLRRLIRKGETGQVLVIVAFGFIVLLGFVGIVTDVSLMFVRYSTLRRAVDSAAVAAAGQVRRSAPTVAELTKAASVLGVPLPDPTNPPTNVKDKASGYAFGRNVANVNLAARQFIELYGLNPSTVIVDTCATLPGDTELCTADRRKIVRVTAQVPSPTVFLRLLGFNTITLEATALSETAVLDVVLIMDVSESQLGDTTYSDWYKAGYPVQYVPPRLTVGGPFRALDSGRWGAVVSPSDQPPDVVYKAWRDAANGVLNKTQPQLDADALFQPKPFIPPVPPNNSKNPPDPPPSLTDGRYAPNTGTAITLADSRNNRAGCRVRFFPASGNGSVGVPSWLRNQYNTYPGINTQLAAVGLTDYPQGFDGFIPTYNFYDCCNNPNGTNGFDDLICQPFKQARDATIQFLDRVDFVRGDRVAIVTFDRTAYLFKPKVSGTTYPAMIDNQSVAVDLIRKGVGVRADPNFYADQNNDGVWDTFVVNGEYGAPPPAYQLVPGVDFGSYDQVYNTRPLGALNNYPVANNCPYQNATLPFPRTLTSSPAATDTIAQGLGFAYNAAQYPDPIQNRSTAPLMNPNLNDPAWDNLIPPGTLAKSRKSSFTYEYWSSCRGTNIGAALRVASNALLDPQTVRVNGAVWVMVLLGDGAAAASDPVRRANTVLPPPDPYRNPPVAGAYGAFGVCPYGTPGDPQGPVRNFNSRYNNFATFPSFPYCSDPAPETRHFCFNPNYNYIDASGQKNFYIELNDPGCDPLYDVDDYARDWADYIGANGPNDPEPWLPDGPNTRRAANIQLPTIFSIGFGLKFPGGTNKCVGVVSSTRDWEDCLGEELLRYVADVGDNNRVDVNYQQDVRADTFPDLTLKAGEQWSSRSACEDAIIGGYRTPPDVPVGQYYNIINPKPAGASCGNYFNAPDGAQLQRVFDEIASRMFTRISR